MDSTNANGDASMPQGEQIDMTPSPDTVSDAMPNHFNAQAREEDAALLDLGPEFRAEQGAQPIFLAEVAQLLRVKVQDKTIDGYSELNPVLRKSLEYAEKFGHISKPSDATEIRVQLNSVTGIHPFEVAQIASLLPKDAEEAKAVIPSLKDRYEDDELNDMISSLEVWLPAMS